MSPMRRFTRLPMHADRRSIKGAIRCNRLARGCLLASPLLQTKVLSVLGSREASDFFLGGTQFSRNFAVSFRQKYRTSGPRRSSMKMYVLWLSHYKSWKGEFVYV